MPKRLRSRNSPPWTFPLPATPPVSTRSCYGASSEGQPVFLRKIKEERTKAYLSGAFG
jgi:hypothetical protein